MKKSSCLLAIIFLCGCGATKEGIADSTTQSPCEQTEGTSVSSQEAPQKAEVSFQSVNPVYHVNCVDSFNRECNSYQVTLGEHIPDFDKYNAILQAGDTDLVQVNGIFQYDAYSEKGYLLDLTEFFANDSHPGMIDRIQNDLSRNGCIYALPTHMAFSTLACSAAYLGDVSSWSIEDYLAFMEEYPNACSGNGRDLTEIKATILANALWGDIDQHIDWENHHPLFSEEPFRSLMTRISALDVSNVSQDRTERAIDGEPVLFVLDFHSAKEIADLESRMGCPLNLIGYPCSEKESSGGLVSYTMLGVSSKSKIADGAKEFISYWMAHADLDTRYGLPTTADALDEEFRKDMNGETYILDGVKYLPVSEEQVGKLSHAIETAHLLRSPQSDFVKIVTEESQPYFAGEKTLDEVIEIINSRVQIILNENSFE